MKIKEPYRYDLYNEGQEDAYIGPCKKGDYVMYSEWCALKESYDLLLTAKKDLEKFRKNSLEGTD